MRIVRYHRTEFRRPNVPRLAPLPEFVLDVPYLLGGYGVVPPLDALNEVLRLGAMGGGVGPGATWEPFQVGPAEYQLMVDELLSMDLERVRALGHARYVPERVIADPELHDAPTHLAWLRRVSQKYRDAPP